MITVVFAIFIKRQNQHERVWIFLFVITKHYTKPLFHAHPFRIASFLSNCRVESDTANTVKFSPMRFLRVNDNRQHKGGNALQINEHLKKIAEIFYTHVNRLLYRF